MFLPPDVTESNTPTLVTVGAGACANAAGARSPRMATRQATTATVRLMHCLLNLWCVAYDPLKPWRHHQQKQTTDDGFGCTPQGSIRSRKNDPSCPSLPPGRPGFSGAPGRPGRTDCRVPAPGPGGTPPGPPGRASRPSGPAPGCSTPPGAWGRG